MRQSGPASMWRVAVVAAAAIVAVSAIEAPAAAQDPDFHELRWDDRWRRADVGDYMLIGAFAWVAFTAQIALIPDVAGWQGGILLDEPVHDLFAFHDPVIRATFDTLSDTLQWFVFFWPLVVDTGLLTWGLDQNWDVGWNMFTINTLAIATTLAFNWFTKNAIARERPYMRHCRDDPQSDFECNSIDRNRSFYSGHTAFAVTGAGLICMHHSRLPLYGEPGDAVACGVAVGVASAIALFRIFADKHYLSDVLMGAVAGVISGVLMPWFLRYGFDDSPFR